MKRKLSLSHHEIRESNELQPGITEEGNCDEEVARYHFQYVFHPKKRARPSLPKVLVFVLFVEDNTELGNQLKAKQRKSGFLEDFENL